MSRKEQKIEVARIEFYTKDKFQFEQKYDKKTFNRIVRAIFTMSCSQKELWTTIIFRSREGVKVNFG